MQHTKIVMLFSVIFLTYGISFAQNAITKKDSTHLYKNIESYAKKGKFTKFVYPFLNKAGSDSLKPRGKKKSIYKKLIQKPYSTFEGKTIRHINIETLDPFKYSIADTNASATNFLARTGNKLHIKSRELTIRNLLLIRQNHVFDSLLVKESERLVRSRGYVTDVSFFVKEASTNADSVDIFIRELDKWSIIPEFGSSTESLNIKLIDRNLAGLGNEFRNSFSWFDSKGDFAYNLTYTIPNIQNTYIRSKIHYGTDEFRNFAKSFSIDRPFFSPYAKWAAGVSFVQQFTNDSAVSGNFDYKPKGIGFNAQDFWAGSAVQIFKGNTEYQRATKFISTIRFLRIRYVEKPIDSLDPLKIYSNENFYLAGFGISTRKYVQDKFIFKFGVTEDVPVGKVYSITLGYQEKYNTSRVYLGAKYSLGNYYQWGYLYSNIEYGTFFRNLKPEQHVFAASISYFTGLIEIGKWKFRQFAKPQVTIGTNFFNKDSLTINDGYGLDGFNSSVLSGTRRLLFTLQTQSYSPWNILGFKFGPFLVYSIGMLGNETSKFKNSKVYSHIGFGVLIKNENLVINAFQISIAFYPIIPGNGYHIFKMNAFRTSDFGFKDFEIGKPATVVFQ